MDKTLDLEQIRKLITDAHIEEAFTLLIDQLKANNLSLFLDEIRLQQSRYSAWKKEYIQELTSQITGNRIRKSLLASITNIEKHLTKKNNSKT